MVGIVFRGNISPMPMQKITANYHSNGAEEACDIMVSIINIHY